jgi:hypothetical protein
MSRNRGHYLRSIVSAFHASGRCFRLADARAAVLAALGDEAPSDYAIKQGCQLALDGFVREGTLQVDGAGLSAVYWFGKGEHDACAARRSHGRLV